MILISAVGRNIRSCKTKEAFGHIFVINLLFFRKCIQIAVNPLHDAVPFKQCPGNEQRVLQIHLILFVIAVICKFSITRQGKISCFF